MTTIVKDPQENRPSEVTRIIGSVFAVEDGLVSKSGNEYSRVKVIADNGTPGGSVFWSVTVMKSLKDKIPAELFSRKFAYAKWIGQASTNTYESKKTGKTETGWSMLLNAVELQDGSYISNKKARAEEEEPF